MAVGLISFAAITVIGLMPVGLSALHQAMDTTEEAQILREIGARALLTPYSELSANFNGTTFYYDQDGVLLGNSPAARPDATRFWATTTVYTPIYPGSDAASNLAQSLYTVHIDLMTGPTARPMSSNAYNIQVPNSGN